MQLCRRRSRIVGDIDKIEIKQKQEGKVQKLQGDSAKVKPYAASSTMNQGDT